MSRPREHDDRTAAALLEAAERLAAEDGAAALSVRRVATEIGTTTRAVYSLFGSKEGLMVALGARAFDLLGAMEAALPRTSDPQADLIQGGLIFRRFAREHPVLFQIAIQRVDVSADVVRGFEGPRLEALAILQDGITRLREFGQLGPRSVEAAVWEYHALCEGLAVLEARCGMRDEDAEHLWRDALSSLVRGWACQDPSRQG